MPEQHSIAQQDIKALLKRVRRIEIKARGLSNQLFSGQYHAAFKGLGMSFREVRAYQYGDDVRFIDWNVTARFDEPHVKVFEEERELSVMFLLDISPSMQFGAHHQTWRERMAEITCVLAFAAVQNNDKVGAILFSGNNLKFIPPAKGKAHAMRMLRDLLAADSGGQGKTALAEGLAFLNKVVRKKATVFLLSDFLDGNFADNLRFTNQKHDLVALKLEDPIQSHLPNLGLIEIMNPETFQKCWINSASSKVQMQWKAHWEKHRREVKQICQNAGMDLLVLPNHLDYIKPLKQLFRKRELKR